MKNVKSGYSKVVVFLFFIIFLVSIAGYKYFEWSSFKALSSLVNETDIQELKFTERASKLNNELSAPLVEYFSTSDKLKISEGKEKVAEMKQLLNKVQNNDEEYQSLLSSNIDRYRKLSWRSKLLLGKQKEYYSNILGTQVKYYEKEIEASRMTLASDYLGMSFFQTLEDNYYSGEFNETVGSNTKLIPSSMYILSGLSKYNDSGYKFPHFDEIVNYFPYAEQAFSKHREYFGTLYAVMKDYASGNLESAGYKYTKLQELEGSRHIDYDRLFSENDENSKNLRKEVFGLVVDKYTYLRDYNNSRMSTYPILGKVSFDTIQLGQCQAYTYKDGLIYSITEKYVSESVQSVDEYLAYLNETPPQTDNLDASFDRSSMQIENTKDKLTIKCKSKPNDLSLTFETIKN